jgi:hypothetical protein
VGTHLIELMVETVNYPQFNARLFRIDSFNIIVTASCWSTVMKYTPPATIVHIVKQAAITYKVPDPVILDTVSENSAPKDGITYCGARNYIDVKLTSTEHASPDSSWLSFNYIDTY